MSPGRSFMPSRRYDLQLAGDAGFGERRHSGMTRKRGAKNERTDGGPGGFPKPHAEVEQRLEAKLVKEGPMGCFRRDVGRHHMRQPIGAQHHERSDSGGAHEAVDKDRNTASARCERSSQDRCKLTPPQRGGDAERIAEEPSMAFHRPVNHSALAGEAIVIDARATARPAHPAAAEQRRRYGGGRRGVADTHRQGRRDPHQAAPCRSRWRPHAEMRLPPSQVPW